MEAQETKQGKVIGNVGLLDIRRATKETLAEIKQIGNVGVVYYAPETAGLLTRLNIENVGNTLEIPADAKIMEGRTVISRDFFKNQAEGSTIVLTGMAIVNPDVTEEDVQQGSGDLIIVGRLLCPEHLAGVIQSKVRDLQGQLQVYSQQPKLVMGRLKLDEYYLRSLDDASELMILGQLDASQIVPDDLLAQKIGQLQVEGSIICREENAQALLARLDTKTGSPKTTIVPTGFELVKQDLILDAGLLAALPGQKLYCTKPVQIGDDVDADSLDKTLEALVAESLLVSPAKLKSTMARKCNLLETEAIFYEGELWLMEGEAILLAARFDYLADKATLVVRGELTIAPDVEPKTLAERLAKVHLFGEIFCTPDQMAALQARLGINQGEFIDSAGTETSDENAIGNVGVLKL